MTRSTNHAVSLAFAASMAVGLTAAPAGAVDIPDRFSGVDYRTNIYQIGLNLEWFTLVQPPSRPGDPVSDGWWIHDRVSMSIGGSDFDAAGIAFVNANDPGIDLGWVQVTTVYGVDTTPGEDLPFITGVDPAAPQFWPASDETIYGRNGTPYSSYEAETVNLIQLPDLLDGHNMSWFDFSDPFTQVHLFRTLVPASEIYFPCPSDMNNDGVQDLTDIGSFIGAFLAGQFAADFNADGVYDLTDIAAFIDGFVTGCP